MVGPLHGLKVVEVAGLGPGPFAAMLLADMGAEVIRVERAQAVSGPAPAEPHFDVMLRGRRNVAIDLKDPHGAELFLDLVEQADAVIEGFRPGVMERLGIGPDECLARNPRIVVGRMTGWGQEGPYANLAGHDINYIALAGALAHFARKDAVPAPPLNMVGDFGGGGMFLALGLVAAMLEAQRSGTGQVVDAAMIDGTATLMGQFWSGIATGQFDEANPGTNLLDTGAPFYEVYRCSDGKFISLGSVEPQFYAELLRLLGLEHDEEFAQQMNRDLWPAMHERLQSLFATGTRDDWCARLEGTDICFAPVLTMTEAAEHPHNVSRGLFVDFAGMRQVAPAPRFSRTVSELSVPPAHPGEHTQEVLADWGLPVERIELLVNQGTVVSGASTS